MRQSLTWKLIAAFLLVAIIGLVVTIVLTRLLFVIEFSQIVNEQNEADFVAIVSGYYRANGSWQGVEENYHRPTPPPTNSGPLKKGLPPPPAPLPPPSLMFLLTDTSGIVLISAGPYQTGEKVSPSKLLTGTPIEIDGQVVGKVVQTGQPIQLSPYQEQILAAIYRVLLYATLVAALFALIVGIVLSVSLTRPLRELTKVIHNMTPENLGRQVKIRSRDELGQLTEAFNRLSAELATSNQLRRQMTADIAHELRSPLQIVAGYIESMQDGILEPTPERLDVISAEVEHVNRLVADLRTLTLADSQMLTLNWQTITLQTLLRHAINVYSHQAERTGITLAASYSDDIGTIRGDEERLMQVLGNIISNALRYTPSQGKIQLDAVQVDGKIKVIIQDNGEGISANDLPYVFERFYRAHKARESENGESGLGLAITKAIVEAHHGTITAASPGIGAGATFEITLPVIDAK